MLARAAVGTRSGFARCGRRCRPARADGKPRRFRTAPAISASTSFSDDIRGYDRTATSSGSGTATSGVASRAGLGAPTGVTVSIPHLTALLLDLNAEGRRIIRGVVDKGDLGLLNKTTETRNDETRARTNTTPAWTRRRRLIGASRRTCCARSGRFVPSFASSRRSRTKTRRRRSPNRTTSPICPETCAATIAPFPAAPNGVAPVTAEARAALAGVAASGRAFETTHSTGFVPGHVRDSKRVTEASSVVTPENAEPLDWPPHLLEPVDASAVTVFVDPLDGTNEFAAGARECVTCRWASPWTARRWWASSASRSSRRHRRRRRTRPRRTGVLRLRPPPPAASRGAGAARRDGSRTGRVGKNKPPPRGSSSVGDGGGGWCAR